MNTLSNAQSQRVVRRRKMALTTGEAALDEVPLPSHEFVDTCAYQDVAQPLIIPSRPGTSYFQVGKSL